LGNTYFRVIDIKIKDNKTRQTNLLAEQTKTYNKMSLKS